MASPWCLARDELARGHCDGYIDGRVGGVLHCPTFAGKLDVTTKYIVDLRDRSCRLLCSLLLKARLQYWHLYFFSAGVDFFAGVAEAGSEAEAKSV